MKLLITGGAGFIGSHFIDYMLTEHSTYSVVCLDCLTYAGSTENLKSVMGNDRFKFVKGNINDVALINSLFKTEKFDIVVNFAAESHVDRSISSPEVFFNTNIIGTTNLLSACMRYNVKRFHQISTDEVYGDLPLNSKCSFTELSPLKPSSPYSASKASADLIALSYFRTFSLPVTVSRSSNNYGPCQHAEKLIPMAILNALQHKPIPVYGDGKNIRDWLFVTDHCRAVDKIIHDGKIGEVYNIGGNFELSNIELVKLIIKKLGKSESLISFTPDRQGHDRKYSLNSDKIKSTINFVPTTEFEQGIDKTINWYLKFYFNNK